MPLAQEQYDDSILEEIVCKAVQDTSCSNMVMSTRGEAAVRYLDVMQKILDRKSGSTYVKRPLDADDVDILPNRHGLWRLLIKLSEVADVLPSSLFLDDVKCTDHHSVSGGAFSDVFRGTYHGEEVGLKRLRVFQIELQRHNSKAFHKEALVWRQLSHPSIQQFLGVDSHTFGGQFCMVSHWQQHGSVVDYMSQRKEDGNFLETSQVDLWLLQIAEGLAYLHEEHIVHGDLRGPNILIDEYLHVRLTDFGLTILADTTSYESYRAGAARWMAPELLDPEHFGFYSSRPTYASDVYSYACVCIELYTGSFPFMQYRLTHQVRRQIVQGERPARPTLDDGSPRDMSDAVWELVSCCWHHSSTLRPSASPIVATLRTYISDKHKIAIDSLMRDEDDIRSNHNSCTDSPAQGTCLNSEWWSDSASSFTGSADRLSLDLTSIAPEQRLPKDDAIDVEAAIGQTNHRILSLEFIHSYGSSTSLHLPETYLDMSEEAQADSITEHMNASPACPIVQDDWEEDVELALARPGKRNRHSVNSYASYTSSSYLSKASFNMSETSPDTSDTSLATCAYQHTDADGLSALPADIEDCQSDTDDFSFPEEETSRINARRSTKLRKLLGPEAPPILATGSVNPWCLQDLHISLDPDAALQEGIWEDLRPNVESISGPQLSTTVSHDSSSVFDMLHNSDRVEIRPRRWTADTGTLVGSIQSPFRTRHRAQSNIELVEQPSSNSQLGPEFSRRDIAPRILQTRFSVSRMRETVSTMVADRFRFFS